MSTNLNNIASSTVSVSGNLPKSTIVDSNSTDNGADISDSSAIGVRGIGSQINLNGPTPLFLSSRYLIRPRRQQANLGYFESTKTPIADNYNGLPQIVSLPTIPRKDKSISDIQKNAHKLPSDSQSNLLPDGNLTLLGQLPVVPQNRHLLLVSLNSLVWYAGNPEVFGSQHADPMDQFAWLNQSFNWARRTNAKVRILWHCFYAQNRCFVGFFNDFVTRIFFSNNKLVGRAL
ncbi:unnamed protein product [Protopolystoma xenopodis]|uniref:Uncharacterized protein n=1 Tax=Protopolystoma xenopodis TaxID=117903 RepID=A0A448XMB0_9PLAT|nr:unnamed protein product [Protopolystoma xenopodis]